MLLLLGVGVGKHQKQNVCLKSRFNEKFSHERAMHVFGVQKEFGAIINYSSGLLQFI